MKRCIFITLLVLNCFTSKSQTNYTYEKLIAEASLLHLQKDYKNAVPKLEKAFLIENPDALNAYKAAGMYSLDENKTKAFQYLDLSLDKGWTEADQLLIDPYFDLIRTNYSQEWKAIENKAHLKEQHYVKTLKLPELRKKSIRWELKIKKSDIQKFKLLILDN